MINTCSVVDQFCDSPANLEHPVNVRAVCFCCGEHVCTKCSSKRKYLCYGKQRLCNKCQIEIDGTDKIVLRRMIKLAR